MSQEAVEIETKQDIIIEQKFCHGGFSEPLLKHFLTVVVLLLVSYRFKSMLLSN